MCSDQHVSKGASQGQQAESVAPPSKKGTQDGAMREQSGAKSSLSAGLIGLELTVREGQVHVCVGALDITSMAWLLACSRTRAESLILRSRYNGEMIFQQSTPRSRPAKIPTLVKTPGWHY